MSLQNYFNENKINFIEDCNVYEEEILLGKYKKELGKLTDKSYFSVFV